MKKVIPFTSFPVHGSDILDFALFLESNPAIILLNETEKEMLENLINKFEKQREMNLWAVGNVSSAYEHRFSSGSFLFGEEELPNAEDVRRSYLNYSPFFSIDGGVSTFDRIWIAVQIDIRHSWDDDLNLSNNFPYKFQVMNDWTTKGILSLNTKYLNLMIGRDTTHWGNTLGSTFYASSLLPHMDSLKLNAPVGPLSLDYLLATIMPKRAKYKDVDLAARRNYEDYEYYKNYDSYTSYNSLGEHFGFMKENNEENPSSILFMQNRIGWNYGRVKAALGSTVVYARANNQFLITDFIPVFNHHNADSVPNNFSVILDAQWTIFKGFSLSAMLGFDDIDAKTVGIPDGQTPTIPGAILQIEYSTADDKLFHYYMLEGGYTHYLWGNFQYNEKPDSWFGVYLARSIYRYTSDRYAVLLPLTSPYGPGSLWAKFNGRLSFTQINLKTGLEVLLLFKNSKVNLIDTEYKKNNSLNSFNQWFLTIDIPVTYKWKFAEFLVKPAVLIGQEKTVIECTLGASMSFGRSKKLKIFN